MKRTLRNSPLAPALLALALLTTGCPDKLKNLAEKAKEAERELKALGDESDRYRSKCRDIAAWYRETPPNTAAIAALQPELDREQAFMRDLQAEIPKKLDEIRKEMGELNDVEIGEVAQYLATNALPLVLKALQEKFPLLKIFSDQLLSNAVPKISQSSQIQDQQNSLIKSLAFMPTNQLDSALRQLDMLEAQSFQVSFTPEVLTAGSMSALLDAVGPLPVLAGSFVPQTTVVLEEGLTSSLSYLDSGELAAGTEIVFQLPADWSITAPVTAVSPNLVLQIVGNQPGTNTFKIQVVSELTPGLTNDTITVTFHGVRIGSTTGHAESCVLVSPGRAQKVDFCVFPNPPAAFSGPALKPSGVELSWQGRGLLQQAPQVRGPYTNAAEQISPRTVPTSDPAQYFRIFRP